MGTGGKASEKVFRVFDDFSVGIVCRLTDSGIFFPSNSLFKIKPPVLYNKSAVHQNSDVKRDKEMENIVEELKT
jgi:hypothetical protein